MTSTRPTILYVGDSLMNGYYATSQQTRYSTRTAIRVNGTDTYAQATGGPTGTQISNYLAFYGAGNLPAADVTVIELGTNDFANISLTTFQTNYQSLLAKVQSPTVVCLGPWRHTADVAFDGSAPAAWDATIISAINNSTFVLGTTATFISLYRLKDMPGLIGPVGNSTWKGAADNFHPNDAGHSAIAQLIARAINTTWTGLCLGGYNGVLGLFQPLFDLNDGQFLHLRQNGLDLQQPEQVAVKAFTVRTPGEFVTKAQYKNRMITVECWLGGQGTPLATTLAQLRYLETALARTFEPAPMLLRIALPGSTTYSYASVRTVTHNIKAATQEILAGVFTTVQLKFECAPYLMGDRLFLQNLANNPGFEAPSGGGVQVLNDTFANANNYWLANATYRTVVLADSPVRYYRLGETSGTTATDSGSGAQNGTYNGGYTLGTTGILGGNNDAAVALNGTSGYISAPTTGLPTGNGAFSIECWVNIAANPSAAARLVTFGTNAANQSVQLNLSTNSKAQVLFQGGTALVAATAISFNVWHQIACTWDGTTLTLYVDGASVGTSTPGAANITAGSCLFGTTIGANANWLSGSLDEVSIYSAALTGARITAHYNAGPPTLPTVASNLLTIPNGSQVNFGSPVWGPINNWQVRFQWVTGLTAYFFAHYADANNFVRVSITGAILQLDHRVAGVDNVLGGSITATLTNGNFYWIQFQQWPIAGGLVTDTPRLQAAVYNDSAGSVGSQIATTGVQGAVAANSGLTGQMALMAQSGGNLVVGGNFTTGVNQVQLFGPGGWILAVSGTGGWAGWDTATTYPNGPVKSYASARLEAAYAGTFDCSWRLSTGGANVANSVSHVQVSGAATLGLSAWTQSTGLGANGHIAFSVTEFDSNGNTTFSGLVGTLNGNQPGWVQMSATYTTSASCAFVDVAMRAYDTSAAGASAGAVVWFDNVQVWNQTTTGLTTMPYCELRFPQSPAMLIVSGIVGDAPAPAFFGWSSFLTSFPIGGTLSFAFGRRTIATANAQLVQPSAAVGGTPVTDAGSYGGYYVNFTGSVTPEGLLTNSSDMNGYFNVLGRVKTSNVVGNLPNMNARALLNQYSASSSTSIIYTFYSLYGNPFTLSATWLAANAGALAIPPSSAGTLQDQTHAPIRPQPQWVDNNGPAGTTSVGWQFLLPIDGGLIAGSILNPSNAPSGINNTWIAGFDDGLGVQIGLGVGWTFGLNGNNGIYPGVGYGGPGTTGSGAVNINATNDAYLTLDPGQSVNGFSVNQFGGYVADANGQVLSLHTEIQYAPLYLYPR